MALASLRQLRFPIRWPTVLAATALLAGCAHPVPPAEYRAYLADAAHGLTHTRTVGGATVTCDYYPVPLLVLRDLARTEAAPPPVRDSLARTYAGKTYCALSLAREGGEIENPLVTDPVAYQQALAYLNTGLAADTYLAVGRDSVPALSSMYLRQYGTTGRSTVLVVFDTSQLSVDHGFHLTFRDQRFGLGTLRFPFAAADLAALPALQFE